MPKKFSRQLRDRAFRLYLDDTYSAREIAEQVSQEFREVVTTPTIYSWIRTLDWNTKKKETQAKAMEKMQENESTKLARMQEEHQDLYKTVRDKAGVELNSLTFERAFDAVKALDVGIQGERQVAEGLINIQFIQDVVNILVDEIEDPDLIKRIATKLKVLMASKDNE
jgi:transposase